MSLKRLSIISSGLLLAGSVFAEQSPWLLRLRAIDVIPDESSTRISVIGGHVTRIDDQASGELDISYFFTDHIAAELIAASTRHAVWATGTVLGTVYLGKVNTLPPTLTVQYHFLPGQWLNPYAGVGVNVTTFYDVNPGPVAQRITYGNTVGVALQIGADLALNDNWFINLDLKKVYMKPEVTLYTPVGTLKTDVRIDPWMPAVGIGYRFG